MRIYTLQIHVTNPPDALDNLYHFSEYDNLCREYKKQLSRLGGGEQGMLEKQDPIKDDCGEVSGGFKKMNADGSLVIGSVYDYDILDDDY